MDSALVVQAERMGDALMAFDLVDALAAQHPQAEIVLAGESAFQAGLAPLLPAARFVSLHQREALLSRDWSLAVNVSHRPEAAALLGVVRAERRIGMHRSGAGPLRIEGDFRLLRASIVENDRHNRFHWADLNRLDAAGWGAPPPLTAKSGPIRRVGLFIGASEPDKRPEAAFFAELGKRLRDRGLELVLFGGPAEAGVGAIIARTLGGRIENTAGKLDFAGLIHALKGIDLLVAPDTGPMHLACRLGVRVLNLSMGPVNPHATGPTAPGSLTLQSRLSCRGCWRCERDRPHCKERFGAGAVAHVVYGLTQGRTPHGAGLVRYTTMRDPFGLIALTGDSMRTPRDLWGDFWKRFFLVRLGGKPAAPEIPLTALFAATPRLREPFKASCAELSSLLLPAIRKKLPLADFKRLKPLLRPLAGYIDQTLANADYSTGALSRALADVEALSELVFTA